MRKLFLSLLALAAIACSKQDNNYLVDPTTEKGIEKSADPSAAKTSQGDLTFSQVNDKDTYSLPVIGTFKFHDSRDFSGHIEYTSLTKTWQIVYEGFPKKSVTLYYEGRQFYRFDEDVTFDKVGLFLTCFDDTYNNGDLSSLSKGRNIALSFGRWVVTTQETQTSTVVATNYRRYTGESRETPVTPDGATFYIDLTDLSGLVVVSPEVADSVFVDSYKLWDECEDCDAIDEEFQNYTYGYVLPGLRTIDLWKDGEVNTINRQINAGDYHEIEANNGLTFVENFQQTLNLIVNTGQRTSPSSTNYLNSQIPYNYVSNTSSGWNVTFFVSGINTALWDDDDVYFILHYIDQYGEVHQPAGDQFESDLTTAHEDVKATAHPDNEHWYYTVNLREFLGVTYQTARQVRIRVQSREGENYSQEFLVNIENR